MTSTMTDYHYNAMPARKPVGGSSVALRPAAPAGLPLRQSPMPSHAHSRTVSSNVFPNSTSPVQYTSPTSFPQPNSPQIPQGHAPPLPYGHARRTPSTNTSSTTSSGQNRASTVSISLHRTPSSRSGQSITPTSYVALMRKQKATVWCDRSQQDDPRLALQQKAAKARAAREVTGAGSGQISGFTKKPASANNSGVRGKIRHHGGRQAGYSPATLLVGASGVPARLSASEVGDEGSSGDEGSIKRQGGGRGSGRSSLGSTGRLGTGNWQPRVPGRLSQGGSPSNALSTTDVSPNAPSSGTGEDGGPSAPPKEGGYFSRQPTKASTGSGSSGETRENSFGGVGELDAPSKKIDVEGTGKGAEDLSRRGSVDERAMTMRGPRLFVANPDLSD